MALGLLTKFVTGTFAGTVVLTPAVLFVAPPWAVELTKEKLQAFKVSKGFDACYTFLSNKNKKSLLFLCLKPENNLGSGNTHVAHYYFYNGGNWEEAKSLGKKSNITDVLFVRTNTWLGERDREINNSDEPKANLDSIKEKEMRCDFHHSLAKNSDKKGKRFTCFQEPNSQLKWKLKDFE